MKNLFQRRGLPTFLTIAIAAAMLIHGPIPQLAHYHEFADANARWGIPNAADVLSNVGFVLVGCWGLARMWALRRQAALAHTWPGDALFLAALMLTAFGSGFYHLAPDNSRLVWDRLPIALACAGLLAGMRARTCDTQQSAGVTWLFAALAIASVWWWQYTDQSGAGDLRPYLLLQGLPLLLVPIWQMQYRRPRNERLLFGLAILLYIAAKAAEVYDHALFTSLVFVSGHTIKHLLATAASAVIVAQMVRSAGSRDSGPDGGREARGAPTFESAQHGVPASDRLRTWAGRCRLIAIAATVGITSSCTLMAGMGLVDNGTFLAFALEDAAQQLRKSERDEEVLRYEPLSGIHQTYTVTLCRSKPKHPQSDNGQDEHNGYLTVTGKHPGGTSYHERFVFVPRTLAVTKTNAAVELVLRKNGSRIEVVEAR